MTTIHAIVLITAISTGSGPSTSDSKAAHVFGEIEARYQRGELDADRYHYYRAAAIRAPQRLPADLRSLAGQGAGPKSGTGVLVEAMQHVIRTGDWGGDLQLLLSPPPDLTFSLESTEWPIRVSYATANQAAYAQAILDAADLSWTVQIGDFGFYQPVIEPGFEPYRFYVEDAGSGTAGYTAPYDGNPGTTYSSCFSYIVIDPDLGNGVGATVAHEVNHSMQMSMDCMEQTTFFENTAVLIEGLTHPDFFSSTLWFIPSFQALPWRGLDYFESGSGYQYGGVLWLHYLADKLAVPDAGVFAREIWEASMQGAAFANEPDYFDGIETVAAAYGAAAPDMESLYGDFAESRYFVGGRDDGQHMADANLFNAEPAVGLRHSVEDLPLVDREPPTAQRPAAFGTNYMRLNVTPDWKWPVTVRFEGDTTTRWEVRVVLSGEGQTTVSETMTLDPANWTGALTVAPEGYDEILMVVANVGEWTYDPDTTGHPVANYVYSLEPVVEPPMVTDIVPAAVIRGQLNLHMRVRGENFVYGPLFDVRFNVPMLQVMSIDSFSATEVAFTLTVPAGTDPGYYTIIVTNGDGEEAVGVGLITVVNELHSGEPEPKPKGCQTSATPGPASLVLVLLVLLALRRRRR